MDLLMIQTWLSDLLPKSIISQYASNGFCPLAAMISEVMITAVTMARIGAASPRTSLFRSNLTAAHPPSRARGGRWRRRSWRSPTPPG